jgi:voltage-gated potassium channel
MFRAVFLFTVVAAIGTVGYIYLENWSPEQAFYTTIITMTTVGYGDLTPSHSTSRFFTIGLSLVAVGIAGYAVSSVAAFIVEGNLARMLRGQKVYKLIGKLDNHIIVCGAGRIGKQIALELFKTGTPFIMVEQNPAVLDELLREVEFPFIEGNATQDQVLTLAGIERARGLVTTFSDDKDNAFVVLSARELAKKLNNPRLRIITRVEEEKQRRKLQQAGANVTISPKAVGGQRMAGMLLYPQIHIFLDEMVQAEQQTGQTLRLEEVYVEKINHPDLTEILEQETLTVANIGQHTGLLVVAIKRRDHKQNDPYIYTPRGQTRLEKDDILIVLGTPEERARLRDEAPPNAFEILWSKAERVWAKWEQLFIREDEL